MIGKHVAFPRLPGFRLMSRTDVRTVMAAFALLMIGSAPGHASATAADDDLTRPIAPELAPRWLEPVGPVRVHGATWLVGFTHMNVVMIATDAGLILIDAGLPQAAPAIEASLASAGYRIQDVRYILSSEPHYDHAGGLAALARASGAIVLASAAAAPILRAGHSGAEDPQRAVLFAYPPVSRVRAVRDGQRIRLGNVVVTAHATPGHTPGSMSWSWTSCAKPEAQNGSAPGACADMVFAASLNSRTEGTYRYSDHPKLVRQFRRSLETVRALPCDILITGHPEHSDGDERLEQLRNQPDGYRSAKACEKLADRYAASFALRLHEESQ